MPSLTRHMVGLAFLVNLLACLGPPELDARDAGVPIKIVAFGDSLTSGYGLATREAFPAQLERALKSKGHDAVVVNAGVSGDTTGAGLARLDWVIPDDADAVIVQLGANDALRGQDPEQTRRNLDQIVSKLRARNLNVLIAGMMAPRNLGKDYTDRFDPIFSELAGKHSVLHYPFFLDGVALNPKLNLPDGQHPTADGIAVIVDRILPAVEMLINRVQARIANTPKS